MYFAYIYCIYTLDMLMLFEDRLLHFLFCIDFFTNAAHMAFNKHTFSRLAARLPGGNKAQLLSQMFTLQNPVNTGCITDTATCHK